MQRLSIKYQKGFTLIELLVVIAIIGVLASVVLASLNSARTKGQIAAIKSNLKNMIVQAELSYDDTGSYSGSCASVQKMIDAINNSGGTAACYNYDGITWGVSARLNSDTSKNYAVDSNGVTTFDTADVVGTMSWDAANTACVSTGGRLPNPEQLRGLWLAYGSITPTVFGGNFYWSAITVPTNTVNAYVTQMGYGGRNNFIKTSSYSVHCIH